MLALYITLGVIGYLNIGYWWGKFSWKVWQKKEKSFAGFLCFPTCNLDNKIGSNDAFALICAFEGVENGVETYAKIMAFTWLLKFLWNASMIMLSGGISITGKLLGKTLIPVFRLTAKLASKLVSAACWLPEKIARKISLLHKHQAKQLAQEPPKQLPPAEPDPNQFNIDEYHLILEQKAKTDARLKELEAHPDKEKILALPRRF